MMRANLSVSLVVGFLFGQSFGPSASAREQSPDIFTWQPVSNAAYYEGYVDAAGDRYRFRTAGTRILLAPGERVGEVEAYGRDQSKLPSSLSASREAGASAHPKEMQWDFVPGVEEGLLESSPLPAPQDVSSVPTFQPSLMALGVYIGQEKVNAEAGASQISGVSQVWGLSVARQWSEKDYDAGWVYQWAASLHQLPTPIVKRVSGDGGGGEAPAKDAHLRYQLGFHAGYSLTNHLNLPSDHRVVFYFGLGIWQMPVLQILDKETGHAGLKSSFAVGPQFALHYDYAVDLKHRLVGELTATPYALGRAPGSRNFSGQINALRQVSESWQAKVGVHYGTESAKPKGVCSTAAPQCQEAGETNLRHLSYLAGANWIH